MIRRAVVLVALFGLLFGVVAVIKSLLSSDGQAISASSVDPSDTAPAVGDSVAQPSTVVPETTVPTSVTITTAPADAGRLPTTADPARVYIAGDSDAGTFGPYLEKLLGQTGVVTTSLDYKVSSGLARPDFFDWPAHFATELPVSNPDIVIVTFGGNDGQGLFDLNGPISGLGTVDSDAWRAEYGKRVGAAMDLLSADGRTLIWVGIPNGPSDDFTARLKVQNEVVTAEAAKRPAVVMIDAWNRFTGLDGGYAEYVVDPRDGISKDVRASDGFHLNTNGAEILALDISQAVKADLRERGAQV